MTDDGMAEGKGDRVLYLDVLRVLAVFFVIVLHTSAENWTTTDIHTYEWRILNLFDSISRWAVPALVMISGSLFLSRDIPVKKIYGKYILRLAIAFIVWSFGYTLYFQITEKREGISAFIVSFAKGYYHMWFIYMIIGLYMITPLLRKITTEPKLARYFTVLAVAFAIAIPEITGVVKVFAGEYGDGMETVFDYFDLKFVLGYTVYFVLGYLLSKKRLSKKETALIYFLGVIGFVTTIVFSRLISGKLNKASGMFYDDHTVNVFLATAAVFVLIRNTVSKVRFSKRTIRIITALSKYSFGAYLVHAFIHTQLYQVFHLHSLTYNPIFSVPLVSVITFIISYIISGVLNHIPVIRHYIV